MGSTNSKPTIKEDIKVQNNASTTVERITFKNGEYEVLDKIAEGAFGIVFKVKNTHDGKKYPLKFYIKC